MGDVPLQKVFTDVITTASFTTFVATNAEIAQQAAALRIKYTLKLPDVLQVATAIQTQCDVFLTNALSAQARVRTKGISGRGVAPKPPGS